MVISSGIHRTRNLQSGFFAETVTGRNFMNTIPSKPSKVTGLALRLMYGLSLKGNRDFEHSAKNLEDVQKQKLTQLLSNAESQKSARHFGLHSGMAYDAFKDRMPVTRYNDWEDYVLEQKSSPGEILTKEHCDRYQPTSGSSSKMKWIPYTPSFLSELDRAVSPMLVDAFRNHPGIFRGKHYWSLSWIPTHLRTKISPDANDDLKLLPWWKRFFMGQLMAVPTEISYAATSDGAMISSLAHLLATSDLTMISVWSPTFALNMFEQIEKHRDDLIHILKHGNWGSLSQELSHISCPYSPYAASVLEDWDGNISAGFLKRFWPYMALISSWDTSSSKIWAEELKNLFPESGFLGKGLWATEGVVTIPYKGTFPLAATCHFYEFIDQETNKIHPCWDLKAGQVLRPLLTTGSGFFRYDLNDQVRVSGFLGQLPCLEFLGRTDGVDMTGEKLTPDIAVEVIKKTDKHFQVKPMSLLGIQGNRKSHEKPGYVLLCECPRDEMLADRIAGFASSLLEESFHYKLATEIGQLSPLKAVLHPQCRKIYQERNEKRGMILGDMKIEPLVLWNEEDSEYIGRLTSSPSDH